jgi:ABC-type dipeptide/oligopeptide/nickel transport system permease subunit
VTTGPPVEPTVELTPAPGVGSTAAGSPIVARTPLELFWRRLRRDRLALVAFIYIVILILAAILAPLIVRLAGAHPPNEQSITALNSFGEPGHPSRSFLFGTDELGRDVFSRTLYGARISLEVALIATALIVVIGVTLGMISGYYRGMTDTLLARTFDVLLAFPVLLLALGLAAACSLGGGCLKVNYHSLGIGFLIGAAVLAVALNAYWMRRDRAQDRPSPTIRQLIVRNLPCIVLLAIGLVLRGLYGTRGALIQPGLNVVILIITLAGVPYMARLIRGQVLSLREKEFVEAMHSVGASDSRIIFLHILPNLVAPIIVYATLLIPQNILFEAALSFLGIGVQPPTASWGAMIASAISVFNVAWWYMTFPGCALLLTVLAFNLLGDAVQDALDPRHAGRAAS